MITIEQSVGRGGRNRADDVRVVQTLMNQRMALVAPLAPFEVNGLSSPELEIAIEGFQSKVMRLATADGRVDPHGVTLTRLNEPGWLSIARAETGTREIRGAQNNPRILEYISTFPYLDTIASDAIPGKKMGEVDETAWCACFVNWCLLQAGKTKGPSAMARDWATYGQKLDAPRPGAICVVFRTPAQASSGVTATGFHVAFWTGEMGNSLTLLGGNQSTSDRITEEVNERTSTGYWTAKAYRWPA